jgi:hypothetical protein
VFSDEATFRTGHVVRTLVWRPIGVQTAFEERYTLPNAQSGRRSVSIFGIMSGRGLGLLFRIDGRFDGQKYVEILDNIVLSYIEDQFPNNHKFYYQDNSSIHRSRVATHWFEQNLNPSQLIRPPSKSFDINPIENVWV